MLQVFADSMMVASRLDDRAYTFATPAKDDLASTACAGGGPALPWGPLNRAYRLFKWANR